MNIKEALSILGVETGVASPDSIKLAYRKAAQKYHPDRNPSGEHMMKLINAAYELVKNHEGQVEAGEDFGATLNKALNAIFGLGLIIEVCGSWIWVTGETRIHKEVLKAAGYFWAAKKLCWYFRAESKKGNRGANWPMDQIRETFGSKKVSGFQPKLTAF